jgi:hypothetical protein
MQAMKLEPYRIVAKCIHLKKAMEGKGFCDLMLPHCLDNRLTDGGKVVSIRRLYAQKDSWYSFLLDAESTQGAIIRLEILGRLKLPVISLRIEPATFRLVA